MIKQLRARLIAAAMLALSLVLLVIIGGINGMSYRKTLSDADAILSVLASNEGMFPQRTPPAGAEESPREPPGGSLLRRHEISDETPYASRVFSVLLDGSGGVHRPLAAGACGRLCAAGDLLGPDCGAHGPGI